MCDCFSDLSGDQLLIADPDGVVRYNSNGTESEYWHQLY